MATSITIQAYPRQYSDLVLGGVLSTDLGTGKKEATLTKTATMNIGSVIASDLTEATSAAEADSVLVFTDAAFTIDDVAVGEQFTGVLLKRFYTLNRFLVVDTTGEAVGDDYVEALEAKGLKLTEKVLFTS